MGTLGNVANYTSILLGRVSCTTSHQLVQQHGDGHFRGLGINGIRDMLDGLSVPELLLANGLETPAARHDR